MSKINLKLPEELKPSYDPDIGVFRVVEAMDIYRENVARTGDLQGSRRVFFEDILTPYYIDGVARGGEEELVEHLVYWLSGFLTEAERQNTPIYPTEGGPIIIEGVAWDSLENWRNCFACDPYHKLPPIDTNSPELAQLLELVSG